MRFGDLTKRMFDIVASGVGLLVTSVPMVLVAMGVALDVGRPILFRQPRAGLGGEPFTLYKFRTMTDARGPDGNPLPDKRRITRLGAFLRRTTLDELPALLNVLKGDMAVVGPRPLLVRYRDRYTREQARRHEVKPGLTGWAVVHGRNALTWEERFALDVWYVDHRSFSLDLKILWKTLVLVARREGVSAEGHATMPEFQGRAR